MNPTEEMTYRQGIVSTLNAIEKDVIEIKLQTQKTNGRVSTLERWQSYVLGFCACLVILMLPLVWSLISSGKLL